MPQGAASGTEEAAGGAAEPGVEALGFGDGAIGFKEAVGAPDLGEVPGGDCREEAQGTALVTRGVEAGEILPAQCLDGIEQGGEGFVHGVPAFRVKFCAYHTPNPGVWQLRSPL